jgi:hypothetical protein
MRVIIAAAAAALARADYAVTILQKGKTPAISTLNARGNGYSPCEFTFNPAFIPAPPGGKSALIVRASGCPADFGGSTDHLLMVYCNVTAAGGVCEDVLPTQFTGFEAVAEDPRIFEFNGFTYLFYFASGVGQATVYLRRTKTPLNPSSWEHVAGPLAWHRNGCTIIRPDGRHFVMFGESPPLPGLGIATTTDFVNFDVINATYMKPNGAANTAAPEIVIEAGSTPVQLSTGDYLHLYAAGTPGWVANGNYTGGCASTNTRLLRPQLQL